MANPDFTYEVQTLRSDVRNAFDTAHRDLDAAVTALTALPQNASDDARQKAQAKLKSAQALVTSTMAQVTQVETLDSDGIGRDGYAAAVALMQTIERTAYAVCLQIGTLSLQAVPATAADAAAINERLSALAGVLEALGKLSPMPLWQQGSGAGSATRG